ncbi:MAG: hypothetical protein ABH836_07975, partial [Candidatus Omnitrophota bacterium]
TAEKTFSEKLMFGPFKVAEAAPLTISASYAKTDTFLNNNAFAIPNKFAIIEGTGSLGAWFMGNGSASIFTKLAGLTFEGLPANNDFNDLDAGDGIVTPSSQTGIAGNENCEAVYEVEATHLTECSDWQTILQAIDDKPEIESVEAHYTPPMFGCNLSIKLKDYLLADIEIAEIMIDGEKMDLSSIPRMDEFYDEESGVYKPYKKYGSDFLKERGGIMQGEFGISFPMGNRIDIKIRNAGGKTAECTLFIPSEYAVKSGDGSAESHFGDEQSWSDVKEQAYSILWKNLDWTYNNGFREKIICGSIESWSFHQDHVIGDNWFTMCKAVIAETLDCKINFKLDIDNRQVKSIKFVGIGRKNMRKRKRTREVQTKEDFTILACKGNNLLSRIETDSFDNGDKIEIDINPQDINLNGNNILEFRPNFSAYNAIINPPSLTSPLIEHDCVMCRESGTSYSRTAEIYYPCLVVTYEDEAEEKEE